MLAHYVYTADSSGIKTGSIYYITRIALRKLPHCCSVILVAIAA